MSDGGVGGGDGLGILVVEDEPANRALIRAILARAKAPELHGHVLHEAGSLAEARAVLAAKPIDIVLLDVRLPDGNGLELAADVRASASRAARIVIVSASVLPAERTRAVESGADAFLGKPFGAGDLIGLLATLVHNSPDGPDPA